MSIWQVFALTCKVLQAHDRLGKMISDAELLPQVLGPSQSGLWSQRQFAKRAKKQLKNAHADVFHMSLLRVMLWDFIFGKGLRSGGPIATVLRDNHERLLELKKEHEALTSSVDTPDTLPRYLRVYGRRIPFQQALQLLEQGLPNDLQLYPDPFVLNVIRVEHKGNLKYFCSHKLLKNGAVVFQDRASCIPAQVAGIRPGMFVLDVCAAPGSPKLRCFCIDMLENQGRVLAVEKDPRRALTLIKRIRSSMRLEGPFSCLRCRRNVSLDKIQRLGERLQGKTEAHTTNSSYDTEIHFMNKEGTLFVHVFIRDALHIDLAVLSSPPVCQDCKKRGSGLPSVQEYLSPDVIVVDPSCSGSGMPLHHLEVRGDLEVSCAKRRENLLKFQRALLTHILSRFSSCPCILYSTCSSSILENECVIIDALESAGGAFRLENINSRCWKQEATDEMKQQYVSNAPRERTKLEKAYTHCFHSSIDVDECRGFFLAQLSPQCSVVK